MTLANDVSIETRKLARIVKLDNVFPHPNADKLDLAIVGGWQCVTNKENGFKTGDFAIYLEVDSLLPLSNPAFAFLDSSKNYTVGEESYARLRTIKLRKELSQGLLLPLNVLGGYTSAVEGTCVTDRLGIIKYEQAVKVTPTRTASAAEQKSWIMRKLFTMLPGQRSQPFPKFIPKTDQERVQNMVRGYNEAVASKEQFEVTYKLDGSSLTAYHLDGKFGVSSRNFELPTERTKWTFAESFSDFMVELVRRNKRWGFKNPAVRVPAWQTGTEPGVSNFTQLAEDLDLKCRLAALGRNIALQGEMVGPSIQGNFEGVSENQYYVYNVYDIDAKAYMLPTDAVAVVATLGLTMVPLFGTMALPATLPEVLAMAEGKSGLNGKYREGLVFKSLSRDFTFKVISNAYLLKEA
jgi:RNA ligase (TIGR02306 family)